MRCRVANHFAEKYGVLGYFKKENFENEGFHEIFLHDVYEEISRNKKAPFVRNFYENYDGGELPIYALVELLSFGTLSKFYKNMLNEDKKQLLEKDSHWNIFVDRIELLFEKYENVDISTMGFPKNWKALLECTKGETYEGKI